MLKFYFKKVSSFFLDFENTFRTKFSMFLRNEDLVKRLLKNINSPPKTGIAGSGQKHVQGIFWSISKENGISSGTTQ